MGDLFCKVGNHPYIGKSRHLLAKQLKWKIYHETTIIDKHAARVTFLADTVTGK